MIDYSIDDSCRRPHLVVDQTLGGRPATHLKHAVVVIEAKTDDRLATGLKAVLRDKRL